MTDIDYNELVEFWKKLNLNTEHKLYAAFVDGEWRYADNEEDRKIIIEWLERNENG